ncbi:hypothetical protein B0H10DRAFT_2344722, partial [Mycena sp. CBHHK59/15]
MSNDEKAGKILNLYATDEMTLPVTEAALKEYLGDRFLDSVWETTLKRIIGCEGDGDDALQIIADICSSNSRTP